MTGNQHVSDAAASLTARLITDLGIEAAAATTFGKHFIEVMLANGWAPTRQVINTERVTSTKPATPEQVAEYVKRIRANLHPKES